ncbi:MAG: hypothetical protein ABSH22_05500 [Tepidisphaeraceae bacterium]
MPKKKTNQSEPEPTATPDFADEPDPSDMRPFDKAMRGLIQVKKKELKELLDKKKSDEHAR